MKLVSMGLLGQHDWKTRTGLQTGKNCSLAGAKGVQLTKQTRNAATTGNVSNK